MLVLLTVFELKGPLPATTLLQGLVDLTDCGTRDLVQLLGTEVRHQMVVELAAVSEKSAWLERQSVEPVRPIRLQRCHRAMELLVILPLPKRFLHRIVGIVIGQGAAPAELLLAGIRLFRIDRNPQLIAPPQPSPSLITLQRALPPTPRTWPRSHRAHPDRQPG